MADNGTVQGLIALANNGAASMEERRTAAFQAVTIMHKRNVSGEPERLGLDREFERRMFLATLKTSYVDILSKIADVLSPEIGAASGATGYAELNQLCWGFARILGDVVLTPGQVGESLAVVTENLRFVVAAFKDWEARQPTADTTEVRAAIAALFETDPAPEASRAACVSIAARLHYPVQAVECVLDAMVSEGLLRCKGGSYSKVKRPRKARAA